VAAEATTMSGARLMLVAVERTPWLLCAADDVSAALADLELTLGEGPCLDASAVDDPVLEPDLAHPLPGGRWPAFTPGAGAVGVRAVFGFPVHVGVVRMGALGLHRERAGPLTDDQHADALVMADVMARAVLDLQAGAAPGTLAAELADGANLQATVHQASGMVSIQLGVDVGEALVRLRAHAYGEERPLGAVADDVVARRLRFVP
jgi:hypothetical protein